MIRQSRRSGPLAFVSGVLFACGGAQFTAGVDGGTTSPSDAQVVDGAGVCVTPPSVTGDESAFCATEAQLLSACPSECDACHQTDLNNCVALGDSLSASFKGALASCTGHVACGGFATFAGNPCVESQLASASTTAAQKAARAAYCAQCPSNPNECSGYFNPPSDGGAAGLGFIVLLANDNIATSIVSACATSCSLVYETCVLDQFCKTQAPDACNSGYCK